MTTTVVIGRGDVIRFSHPFLSLCPIRPRHSGVTGAPTALCFCTHPPHPFFCLGFPPGDVSWRHMTSLDVAGLKYLEPSCSAGGRDTKLLAALRAAPSHAALTTVPSAARQVRNRSFLTRNGVSIANDGVSPAYCVRVLMAWISKNV